MKKSIKELKEERSGIAQRMHEMLDAIEAREDKAFTDEERASYNNLKKQYETLNERIDLLEKEEARAAQAARPVSGTEPTAEERAATHQQELRSAFIDYIRGSVTNPISNPSCGPTSSPARPTIRSSSRSWYLTRSCMPSRPVVRSSAQSTS